MDKFAVIVVGAGKGDRFGGNENKTLAKLDGRPVFLRSIELFVNREDVCQTIYVVAAADREEVREKYGANLSFMGVVFVDGGATRTESVAAGLRAVREDAKYIAIHDAVRPCTGDDLIASVFEEARKSGAAIPACPLHGTIKRVSEQNIIEETVDRRGLFEAQTPQIFRRDVIEAAYAQADPDRPATDDAQLVEGTGHAVSIVASDSSNLKITTKADVGMAAAALKTRQTAKPVPRLGAFEEAQW
jgi:2-C-methyl-D-erythritol 4-phosphate cytidylyltransferase